MWNLRVCLTATAVGGVTVANNDVLTAVCFWANGFAESGSGVLWGADVPIGDFFDSTAGF